jgi:hypothetical protein
MKGSSPVQRMTANKTTNFTLRAGTKNFLVRNRLQGSRSFLLKGYSGMFT